MAQAALARARAYPQKERRTETNARSWYAYIEERATYPKATPCSNYPRVGSSTARPAQRSGYPIGGTILYVYKFHPKRMKTLGAPKGRYPGGWAFCPLYPRPKLCQCLVNPVQERSPAILELQERLPMYPTGKCRAVQGGFTALL